MNALWERLFWLNDFLGPIANILQVVTVGVAVYGAIEIWRRSRKLRKLLQARKGTFGEGTMALSIGIRQDIKGQVDAFLEAHAGELLADPQQTAAAPTPPAPAVLAEAGEAAVATPVEPVAPAAPVAAGHTIYHESIYRSGNLDSSDYHEVLAEVFRRRQTLANLHCRRVLLFIGGPLALALGVGSMLDNWVPVLVYQWDAKESTYRYVYTLEKGIVLQLLERGA